MERRGKGTTWRAVSKYRIIVHSSVEADVIYSAESGGLNSIAKIDTTLTVIDAFRFFEEFETIELLHQRFASEVETPEDERTVTDLMIDQIEFADVIIVNKVNKYTLQVALQLRKIDGDHWLPLYRLTWSKIRS